MTLAFKARQAVIEAIKNGETALLERKVATSDKEKPWADDTILNIKRNIKVFPFEPLTDRLNDTSVPGVRIEKMATDDTKEIKVGDTITFGKPKKTYTVRSYTPYKLSGQMIFQILDMEK